MWLTLTVAFLVVWSVSVGLFHVPGNFIHLLAVAAMACGAVHLMTRRRLREASNRLGPRG